VKKPRALVVDDEPDIRELLSITLERMNLDVTAADTIAAGTGEVRANPFDLCLSDMRLPDGDGVELCREIRSRHPEVQALMLTSFDDDEALLLFEATGAELEALCRAADEVRAERWGETVTYVVNRNINFTNVCYTGCRFCAFAQRRDDADAYELSLAEIADRAAEAWEAGATEVCMQGGIHPDLPGDFYFRLLDAVKERVPGIHVHAFSPMEVLNGATRLGVSFREFLEECVRRGLGSIPGTAAEILDDDVRWVLTKGKLPADTWEEIVTTAHEVGLRSSSTIMYGHVDAPTHWVAHIRRLARMQDRTGGFTEFVPLPFVHQNAPIYLAGKARAASTF
jgi:FO synthase